MATERGNQEIEHQEPTPKLYMTSPKVTLDPSNVLPLSAPVPTVVMP